MKPCFFLFFTLLLAVCTAAAQGPDDDWAGLDRYRQANLETPAGMQAVLMGNSITEGWQAVHPDFFTENRLVCRGIGGQTTSQMLVRFRSDVLDLQPRAVAIMAGTNDLARNNGRIRREDIFGNIVMMVELAQWHGIRVLLCSVPPAASFPWRPGIDPVEDIRWLNAKLREYAQEYNLTYVDYYSALADEQGGMQARYSADGVHPNEAGYRVMEAILLPLLEDV